MILGIQELGQLPAVSAANCQINWTVQPNTIIFSAIRAATSAPEYGAQNIQVTDTPAAVGVVMKAEEDADDKKQKKEVMQFLSVQSTSTWRHRS